jgi:methylenetetrahydrofolate dehydrogenase (NADP+)/methenyltetrahydrofolate cyclohydrolase
LTARILDGKALARKIEAEIADDVVEFIQNNVLAPRLDVVLVGEDPASEVYVRGKRRACERVGIDGQLHRLADDVAEDELLGLIAKLNGDDAVHGILVQLPLPGQIDATAVLRAVNPSKDVDAFHPENVGRLVQGNPRFLPCTPQGIQQLLVREKIETAGRHVVVIGRSEIVGKPIANILLQRGAAADATVTVCHSRTADLPSITRQAEILIVAIGRPRFVTAEMVRPGATVIDVGVNRTEDGLVGDVDFDGVREVAGAITPVPGGVGPLTIAMVLSNTLEAARCSI